MADIRIHRDHTLGLKKARKIAWQWAEQVERDFEMSCVVIEGEDSDVVEFKRPGVTGTLGVSAEAFDLHARLGLLMSAFSKTIEGEILKALDELLDKGSTAPARKAPAKKAAARKRPAA